MTVNKAAAGNTRELHHKSSAAAAGFNITGFKFHTHSEGDFEDVLDDAAADSDTTVPTTQSPMLGQHETKSVVQDTIVEAAEEPAAAFICEPPAVVAVTVEQRQASQQSLPQPAATAAGTAAGTTASPEKDTSGELHRVNLDEEEDDEWEDQPAPYINEAADMMEGTAEAKEEVAAVSQGQGREAAGTAAEYDPSCRRRDLYDDEDEWAELVIKQKAKGW